MALRRNVAQYGFACAVSLALAAAAQAQPASTGGGGQMAYPDNNKAGAITIPGSTSRDTGSMQYPTSPGGVPSASAPRSDNTGSMGYPAGNSLGSKKAAAAKSSTASGTAAATSAPAAAAPSGSGPTPQGMAAARKLATAPGAAPVPYVDFTQPSATAAKPMHHAAAKPAKKPSA